MKILHVCSYYITSKLYKNLVENLEDRGIYDDVYIPVSSNDMINKYSGVNNKKTKYIYSKCFGKFDRVSFKFKNKKIYDDILKKVDFDNVDVVHAHSLFVNGYVAYKLKKEKNIDYIVAVRNTDANVFFKKMIHLRKIGVEIMKNAKAVIFISSKYRQSVIENYVHKDLQELIWNKSYVIPNGIDEFWFENLDLRNKTIDKKNIKLIYVGKLDKNKNIYTSMKVIKRLNELGYKATLDIVGNGPELENIKSLVLGEYKDYVNLLGFKKREELLHLYRQSDIFIMPSKYETFGLVYIEAISQSLPVIYTENQGFDGYFEEGKVGYRVKYDDIEEITQKVIQIVDKPEWDFKKLEVELKKSFIWKNIAIQYEEIYRK